MNSLDKLLINVGDMSLKRRAKRITETLELKEGDKVLDIGCGDGFYLHLLSSLNIKLYLTGFDLSKTSLATAKTNLGNKKIKLVQGDLMNGLPFESSSFDKVIMSEVLEHLPDDAKGLKEVYRVLKPNGILSLSVPSANYPVLWDPVNWTLEKLFRTHIKTGFWAGIWNQHLRLYTEEHLVRVLKKNGFSVDRMEPVTYWCLPFSHYLVNFAARLFYAKSFSMEISSDISKFSIKDKKNTKTAEIAFFIVNLIDKLNDFLPMESGVSILIKAKNRPSINIE